MQKFLFSADFVLSMRWNDPRLQYTDLREETYLNTLDKATQAKIWSPSLGFTNAKVGVASRLKARPHNSKRVQIYFCVKFANLTKKAFFRSIFLCNNFYYSYFIGLKFCSLVELSPTKFSSGPCHCLTATKIPFMYSFSGNCGGLSPKFHIHVSVSDFYILKIGPHIFL